MRKQPKSQPNKPTTSFTCYTVTKSQRGSNSAQVFELTITDGQLTAIKEVSRAPDLPALAIAKAAEGLWNCFRTQYTNEVVGEPTQLS